MNDDIIDDAFDWGALPAPSGTADFTYIETSFDAVDQRSWRALYTNESKEYYADEPLAAGALVYKRGRSLRPVTPWANPTPPNNPWRKDGPAAAPAATVEELKRQLEEFQRYQEAMERRGAPPQAKPPEQALPTTPESGPGARKIADRAGDL